MLNECLILLNWQRLNGAGGENLFLDLSLLAPMVNVSEDGFAEAKLYWKQGQHTLGFARKACFPRQR